MLTLTLVAAEGVPPLRFGMTAAEAAAAMAPWGTVTFNQPSRPAESRINVHDDGCIWKWTAATGRWQCVWNEHAEQDWDAGLRDELAP